MKQTLYSFKISEDKVLVEQLDMFNKLILDLENIEVKIDDEDQVLLLLYALPRSHTHFKETLLYGREYLTIEEVQSTLYFNYLNERNEHKPYSIGEGLFVKGKSSKKDGKYERKKCMVLKNSYGGNTPAIRCYHCKKEGHTKKVCLDRINNHSGKDIGNPSIVQDYY